MAGPGLASGDMQKPVDMAVIAAMNMKDRSVAPKIKKATFTLAEKLVKAEAEKSPADVLRALSKEDEKPQYNLSAPQQDIAHFGGDAGALNNAGKVVEKPGIAPAQKERLNNGRKAIEDVSMVMFYMDVLKIPEGPGRQAEVTRLAAENPAFKALGINTIGTLEDNAIEVMMTNEGIKKVLQTFPDADKYNDGEKMAIIKEAMLVDTKFRDSVSKNFQAIHEKLLKLPDASQEGVAKLTADQNVATKALNDASTDMSERLKRTVTAGGDPNLQNLTPAEVEAFMKGSANEKEFKRNLAVKFGADNTTISQVVKYTEIEQEIARINKQLEGQLDDTTHTQTVSIEDKSVADIIKKTTDSTPTRIEGTQRKALAQKVADLKAELVQIEGAVNDFDKNLSIYNSVASFTNGAEVRADITNGVRASFDIDRLQTQIGAAAGGEISASLNTRLDQEDAIIREIQKVLGKSLGEAWSEKMDETNKLKDELMEKMIAEASTESEKELLRKMKTGYVEYDVARRETTIHGDNIMEGAKLVAMEDRGVMLAMARDMGFIDGDDVSDIFAKQKDKTKQGAEWQQRRVDELLKGLSEAEKAVVDKMLTDHGSEYRQKVYGGYLQMQDYLKEGLFGRSIRLGRKVKYDGSGLRLIQMAKGETKLNIDELNALHTYCKADIDTAIEGNRDAKKFINKMKESGMVGNADFLKKLAWLLFVVLGLGGGGIGAIAAGGLATAPALTGAISGALGGKFGTDLAGGAINKLAI